MGLKSDIVTLVSGSVVTATGQTSTVDISGYEDLAVLVSVASVSGTTPSLTPYLQISPDGGTTWFGTASGPAGGSAMTANGQQYIGVSGNYLGGRARLAYTVSGTTPSFTLTAWLMARR
jgi:hypothetical protein